MLHIKIIDIKKDKIKTSVAETFKNLSHMVHQLSLTAQSEILMKIKKLLE